MKKLLIVVNTISLFSVLMIATATGAEDKMASADCGNMVEGKWNIKKAADIKSHLKHRLKIEKTEAGKYSVKIKNEEGDTIFKSKEGFNLACDNASASATISGQIKMGNCMHSMEIGSPYMNDADQISIKLTSTHGKGECTGHKDSLHGNDRKNHMQVAYAKRAGK